VNPKTDEEEIFSDIISLLHCFAMKMYSQRRKNKLRIVKEDLENEIGV
jgi:predicted site-specific integrase-resolvase